MVIDSSKDLIRNLHFDFIDGLRGLAVLMVLFFHTSLVVGKIEDYQSKRIILEHFSLGVQLFFIISAFTLFRSYDLRKYSDRKPIKSFYIRRFFRIFPLWWIAVILYWILLRNNHTAFDAWATAFMFFGFYQEAQFISLIPVGWSLFVEEVFYWIFPIIKKIVTNLIIAILFTIGAVIVAKVWIKYAGNQGFNSFFIGTFPLANFYAFFIGISLFFLYKIFEKINLLQTQSRNVHYLDILGITCFIMAIRYYPRLEGAFLITPFIITSFFQKSYISKMLRIKTLKSFGKHCYSIYLFHTLIITQVCIWSNDIPSQLDLSGFNFLIIIINLFLIVAFLSYGLGFLSYNLFEIRFINLGKKVIKKLDY